jgi:hypothetical protein
LPVRSGHTTMLHAVLRLHPRPRNSFNLHSRRVMHIAVGTNSPLSIHGSQWLWITFGVLAAS